MPDYKIRSARVSDAPALVEIYRPYVEETAITFEYKTPSVKEFQRRIELISEKHPYLVLEENGEILGYAYASSLSPRPAYDWSVEMSIYITQKSRHSGLGKALYVALEEALQKQGIKNLYACITYPEEGDPYVTRNSVNFHTHMGYHIAGTFHQCGYKFHRWYDIVWMEKVMR